MRNRVKSLTIFIVLLVIEIGKFAHAYMGLSSNTKHPELYTWILLIIVESLVCLCIYNLYKKTKKKWILYMSPVILIATMYLTTLISWFIF